MRCSELRSLVQSLPLNSVHFCFEMLVSLFTMRESSPFSATPLWGIRVRFPFEPETAFHDYSLVTVRVLTVEPTP